MNYDDNTYMLSIIKDEKKIINKTVYIFTYNLFKYIFIKRQKDQPEVVGKLDSFIKKINEKIIKENKYISKDYSIGNFKNIIEFIKWQNKMFSGEIIEGILIYVFSFAFKASKEKTFGKYIHNNISKLKDPRDFEICEMFNLEKFKPEELGNFEELLNIDATADDKINTRITEGQKNSVLFNLLFQVFYEKYIDVKKIYSNYNKSMNYINKGFSDNQKISSDIYDKLKDNSNTALDKDISSNSINTLISQLFFPNEFGKISRAPIRIIRSFLIQVFIYSQNSHSPLMKYITKDPDSKYEVIPFTYDLKGACVEGRFAYIILSPVRIEPRITKMVLTQNNLRECGFYELGKISIFNKNVKSIEINTSLIRNYYVEYLNRVMGLFDNDSLEELNISFNYLKDISEEYFTKLISHFKGLKSLNLTMNEFKRGVSSLFIVLKKLYRKGKTKLETLFLNRCLFDEATFYELGELLKCKYCKLKKLFLNGNAIPYNINFFKKLKKNKSLTEIYLNKAEIGNNNVDDILKIISTTHIHYLYLYKNKISSFNYLLELLYRTKKVIDNDDIDYNKKNESFLTNIDLSNNEIYIKNEGHIELLKNIFKKTTLNCMDISHILLGSNPVKNRIDNNNYKLKVEKIKKILEDDKNKLNSSARLLRKNEVTAKRLAQFNNEDMFNNLDVSEIINNKKAILPVYLREQARIIMNNEENADIRNQFIKDDNIDREQYKNIEDKLVNYITYRLVEKKIKEIKLAKSLAKIILI